MKRIIALVVLFASLTITVTLFAKPAKVAELVTNPETGQQYIQCINPGTTCQV